jgi:hypothetical protein
MNPENCLGQLFRVRVHFPEGESIVLSVLADGEVTHSGHGRLGLDDVASEFFNFCHGSVEGWHADIGSDGLFRMHAFHQAAIGRGVCPAGVHVPIIGHVRQGIDFPPEQFVVKSLRAGSVVRGDFKPDNAGRGFLFGCAHASAFPLMQFTEFLFTNKMVTV